MRALLPQHDSIQEFEQARHDRLYDGLTLWSEGHDHSPAGAVYLLGYTVEMALKCAYFRVLKLPISDPITGSELKTARGKAAVFGITAPPESYHSVRFWCELLREQRRSDNMPLEASLDQELVAETAAVYDRWSVEMRYKASYTALGTLSRVLQAAEWFELNYVRLYSL